MPPWGRARTCVDRLRSEGKRARKDPSRARAPARATCTCETRTARERLLAARVLPLHPPWIVPTNKLACASTTIQVVTSVQARHAPSMGVTRPLASAAARQSPTGLGPPRRGAACMVHETTAARGEGAAFGHDTHCERERCCRRRWIPTASVARRQLRMRGNVVRSEPSFMGGCRGCERHGLARGRALEVRAVQIFFECAGGPTTCPQDVAETASRPADGLCMASPQTL